MTATLSVSVRRGKASGGHRGWLIVLIRGELDIATAPRFAARFDEFLADGSRDLVLDVSKLTFVDVVGLRAFAALRAQAEQRMVAVRLSGVPPQMRRLMRIISPAWEFLSSDRTARAVAAGDG
jgi:anti-anti-sigma factor